MEQETLPKPIVSNGDILENMNVYEASLEKHTSYDVVARLNMTTAYGAGARNVRDAYEAELLALRKKMAEMEGAGNAMRHFIRVKFDEADILAEAQVVFAWDASLNPQGS